MTDTTLELQATITTDPLSFTTSVISNAVRNLWSGSLTEAVPGRFLLRRNDNGGDGLAVKRASIHDFRVHAAKEPSP